MMLARVADSLYWIGRYVERAEHVSRIADVMLTATLDRTETASQVARIGLCAVGEATDERIAAPFEAAKDLALDRLDGGSVISSIARARENARQVRDQITSETWERLNMLHLRLSGAQAAKAFGDGSTAFLHEVIADLHLFKGAADATMSHGEGWRFLLLGVHLERAQLIGRLLEVCFGRSGERLDHATLTAVLRMSCALEPYLRVYTADVRAASILEFLLLNAEFPRSIRFSTDQIEAHLSTLGRLGAAEQVGPDRLAGRLKARLQYADMSEIEREGSHTFLEAVLGECGAIHRGVYEAFVAYPLEMRLPA